MTIKKSSVYFFFLVLVISFLSTVLLKIDSDYIIYVIDLNKASSMTFIEYINEIDYEYAYNILLYVFNFFGISSEHAYVLFSNILLYFLIIKVIDNSTKSFSLNRKILLSIIIICNPLLFILSSNIIRQLLSNSIFFFIVTNSSFLNSNKKYKYFLFILPTSIHISSSLLIIGYLTGSIKKLENRTFLMIVFILPALFSGLLYNYYGLNIFHFNIYEPPNSYLILISIIMLYILYIKKISIPLLYSQLLTISLIIGLYDLSQFSSRMILIIHFIYLFFIINIFKKINIKFLKLITLASIVIFTTFLYNYLS